MLCGAGGGGGGGGGVGDETGWTLFWIALPRETEEDSVGVTCDEESRMVTRLPLALPPTVALLTGVTCDDDSLSVTLLSRLLFFSGVIWVELCLKVTRLSV